MMVEEFNVCAVLKEFEYKNQISYSVHYGVYYVVDFLCQVS